MNGLTFAQSTWFWGLLALLPLLLLRIVGQFRSTRNLAGLVSPRLITSLVAGASISRRWTVFLMRLLALACIIVALARPQMGFEEIPIETDAHNLLLAIDTSKSMMADDLAPNRLTRAKLAAIDLVRALPEDRIGVIAFAGMAFLQAPLTVDHEAITETIDELDTEIIQRGGSNLSAVVKLAVDTVKELQSGSGALIIFSDGEAFEGLTEIENVRDAAKEAGMSILTVGVGTEAGAIIPETGADGRAIPGKFIKDEQGQIVKTRLEPTSLKALASNGGRYLHLDGSTPLAGAVNQILSDIKRTREEGKAALRPLERFLWPLSVGFALLVLSHLIPLFWRKPTLTRKFPMKNSSPVAAIILIFLLPLPLPQLAAEGLRKGWEALNKEDYQGAIAAYEETLKEKSSSAEQAQAYLGLGSAAYRLGNFEQAADEFSRVVTIGTPELQTQALYNLGNTLFRRGESALNTAQSDKTGQSGMQLNEQSRAAAIKDWEAAIEHYQGSLSINPKSENTAHNLAVVKKRLEELKKEQEKEQQQQQQQQQQKDQDKKDKNGNQDKKDQSKQDQDKQDSQQGQNQQKDQDKSEAGKQGDPSEKNPSDSENSPNEMNPDPKNPKGAGEQNKSQSDTNPEDQKKNSPASKPDPADAPPERADPQDGKLEANPNQASQEAPAQPRPMQEGDADQQTNPETGYAPSEVRHLLESLTDETAVRLRSPKPSGTEKKFKDW